MRRRSRPAFALVTFVGALLACSLSGCAEENPTTSTFELAGYVREAAGGPGIRGVTVTFTSDTRETNTTETNGEGYYEMSVETDGAFGQVRAERDGYQAAEETVFFDTPQRRVDLAMVPLGE